MPVLTFRRRLEPEWRVLSKHLGRCVCPPGDSEHTDCPLTDWMFMGLELNEDRWTYKRYCDHDEHGGKEYLVLDGKGRTLLR